MRANFVFSEVVTGLRRNVTMTIAMILTTAISLGMLGGGLLLVRTIDKMKMRYLDDVEVIVYLDEEISTDDKNCASEECTSIRQSLENNQAIESVVYENRDEAYERFQQIFEDQPELVELARSEALPASLHVKLLDPQRSDAVAEEYGDEAGVHKVDNQNKFVDGVVDLFNSIRNFTFTVALVAALAAILLIANTIQVSAYTRRTEVGIMRLVGATRWYTQLPFLLEAVVAGVSGAVLGVAGLVTLKYTVLNRFLESTEGVIPKIELVDVLFPVAPVMLGVSILISAITGYVTLRMYVRH